MPAVPLERGLCSALPGLPFAAPALLAPRLGGVLPRPTGFRARGGRPEASGMLVMLLRPSAGANDGRAKTPRPTRGFDQEYSGDVLLSQGATPQVPSALAGLTSVFGMGTGVTLPLWSPETLLNTRRGGRRATAPLSVS